MRKRIVFEIKVHRGRRLGGIRSYNAVSRQRVTVCLLAEKHIKGMLSARRSGVSTKAWRV